MKKGLKLKLARILLLALATVSSILSPARAAEVADLSAFDAAIRNNDARSAATIYARFYDDSLSSDGKPQANATLDALAGRLLLLTGDPKGSSAILGQDVQGDTSSKVARQYARAMAELYSGSFATAERLFAEPIPGADREQAEAWALGRAQLALQTHPMDAVAALGEGAQNSGNWRVQYLVAQAAIILKKYDVAQRATDRIALLVQTAPLDDFAPLQLLLLQAALEAARNHRDQVVALLSAMPSSSERASKIAKELANRLPLCGVDGVTKQDFVTVGLATLSRVHIAVFVPFNASRPEVVSTFMHGLSGLTWFERSSAVANGPLVTVRCTVSPPDLFNDDRADRTRTNWLADRHIRPRFLGLEFEREPDPLTLAGRELDRIEARVGPRSPVLAVPLMELANLTESRAKEKGDVPLSAAQPLAARARDLVPEIAAAHPDGDMWLMTPGDMISDLMTRLRTASLDDAYAGSVLLLSSSKLTDLQKLAIAQLVRDRFPAASSDRRAQALTTRSIILLHSLNRSAEALALVRSAHFAPNICGMSSMPSRIESGFSDNDFPYDAAIALISGADVMGVDITREGRASAVRSLVEMPPLVFEADLQTATKRMTFTAPKNASGKAAPCEEYGGFVSWRLPTEGVPVETKMLGPAF